VPAILTGIGSIIAVIGSLITAFVTLGAVSGAVLAGGALAFFQEASNDFEDTQEAIEQMTAALRDLFLEAVQPLMTDANMDLFISTINSAADIVNRFAQFAQMMRGTVLDALGDVEGDVDNFFTAMKFAFVELEPIIIGIINFLTRDLPVIIVRLAELTRKLSDDLTMLVLVFGALLDQLLEFSSTVLAGVAPVVVILVDVLIALFGIINLLPPALVAGAIAGFLFALAVAKLAISLTGLAQVLESTEDELEDQSRAAIIASGAYTKLTATVKAYAAGQIGLIGILKNSVYWLGGALRSAYNAVTISTLRSTFAAKLLKRTYLNLISAIKRVLAFLGLKSAVMTVYTTIMSAATSITTAFAIALNTSLSPVYIAIGIIGVLVAVIGLLVGAFGAIVNFFTGTNIFAPIIEGGKKAISVIKRLIKFLNPFSGLGGAMSMDPSVDDIQTNSQVDLSFQENMEQKVDVQADPEEKAQLSRVTKDAIEEANSFARQRQGTQ
jgi:hypothetical protein